jgi:hypothetical protein
MDTNRAADFGLDRQRPRLTAVVLPGNAPADLGSLTGAGQFGDLDADVRVVVYARASEVGSIAGGQQRTVIAVPDDLAHDHRSLRRLAVQEGSGDVFRFLGGSEAAPRFQAPRRSLRDRLIEAGVPNPNS